MKKLHIFLRRHCILSSLIATAIFWLAMISATFCAVQLFPNLIYGDGYALQCLSELFTAAVGFGLAALFGYHRIWRARGAGFARGLLAGGYFIFISIYGLMSSLQLIIFSSPLNCSLGKVLIFSAAMLLVGFTEELFFRGIVANLFLDRLPRNRYGVLCAVIGSGLVFGLMHLGNAIGMAEPGGAFVQAFVASAMGMALSAIYYRTRNIWSVIFIHFFVDFCALIVPTVFSAYSVSDTISSYSAAQFIGAVPYIIVCIVLLRDSQMERICPFLSAEAKIQSELATMRIFKKYIFIAMLIGFALICAYCFLTL